MEGKVLIAAGSDSGGGAGLQADIKTVTALGGYASTAVTALTAQNTLGVQGIHDVPAAFFKCQMTSIIQDIGVDCIKTGMLNKREIIDAMVELYKELVPSTPLVVDPVMVSKDGTQLLKADTSGLLKDRLIPLATIITPNIPEAEVLLERAISSSQEMVNAAKDLLDLGSNFVLLKGGHLEGDPVSDVLVGPKEIQVFESPRIYTRHTHGTGCTLASAIATGISKGFTIKDAVDSARSYLLKAIATAPGFGAGHGPVNHGHTMNLGH